MPAPNQDILGGLKIAMSRGSSLKQAMMSFYNANYGKQEIEEAAQALVHEMQQQQKPIVKKPVVSNVYSKAKFIPKTSAVGGHKPSAPKPVQKVSAYETKKQTGWLRGKLIIIVLSIVLAILLGVLFVLIFFRGALFG